MKVQAYLFKNFDSPVININEACRRKQTLAEKWETWIYYDLVKLRPMVATQRNSSASSFTFLGQKKNGIHRRGSKGLAHELVQQYICNLPDEWSFRIFGKEINLKIDSIEDEYHIVDPETGQNRFVDCMILLKPECEFYELFGGRLGVEVTDTSKTGTTKRKTFQRCKINVVELKMIEDWHIENKKHYEKEEIFKLRARIKGFLNKEPFLNSLYLLNRID